MNKIFLLFFTLCLYVATAQNQKKQHQQISSLHKEICDKTCAALKDEASKPKDYVTLTQELEERLKKVKKIMDEISTSPGSTADKETAGHLTAMETYHTQATYYLGLAKKEIAKKETKNKNIDTHLKNLDKAVRSAEKENQAFNK